MIGRIQSRQLFLERIADAALDTDGTDRCITVRAHARDILDARERRLVDEPLAMATRERIVLMQFAVLVDVT